MVVFLSLLIALSVGWSLYYIAVRIDRERLKVKWLSPDPVKHSESAFILFNRPLVSLCKPVLQKLNLSQKKCYAFLLGSEGFLLSCLLFGYAPFIQLTAGAAAGSYPYVWEFLQEKKKRRLIEREIPFMLDLLALSVAAGQDFIQAIQKIVAVLPRSYLTEELKKMLFDIQLGKTRVAALQAFQRRISIGSLSNWVSLLIQGFKWGSPVAPLLADAADTAREFRLIRAEQSGIAASQKMLVPLICCILPSSFLILFGPLMVRFFTQGLQGLL